MSLVCVEFHSRTSENTLESRETSTIKITIHTHRHRNVVIFPRGFYFYYYKSYLRPFSRDPFVWTVISRTASFCLWLSFLSPSTTELIVHNQCRVDFSNESSFDTFHSSGFHALRSTVLGTLCPVSYSPSVVTTLSTILFTQGTDFTMLWFLI